MIASCTTIQIVSISNTLHNALANSRLVLYFSCKSNLLVLYFYFATNRPIPITFLTGDGRYGKVYRCELYHFEVALKVFTSAGKGYNSWLQECRHYTQSPLHHENVLSFIVADTDFQVPTQYLIVTHYHPKGMCELWELIETLFACSCA